MIKKYFLINLTFLALVSCVSKERDSGKKISQVSKGVPHMSFSDLISGPSTGLGDGKGSGVIVTVWGYKFGVYGNSSTVEFCPNSGGCIKSDHIYYWKNADGILPSGPANLFESHGMQEVAFSIPNTGNGPGTIRLSNSFGYSELPFTIRDGNIYHVMNSGNDSSGDGSFANPWLSVAKADSNSGAIAGDTLYIHNVTTGDENATQAIYNNQIAAQSTLDNQFVYASYPNSRAEVIGERGFSMWTSSGFTGGMVASKLSFFTAEADLGANDQAINSRSGSGTSRITYAVQGTQNGRIVGNYITDEHPDDVTGACATGAQGAIVAGNGTGSANIKILGNHVKEYGCAGSIKFHHTTYLTIRSGNANLQVPPPELSWNYLQNNHTKNGIHLYDENNSGLECGSYTGDVVISNNVVVNQGGAGVNIGANCPWTNDFHVFNNILINVGLAAAWDGLDVNTSNGPDTGAINVTDGGLSGTVHIYNNTIIGWNSDGQTNGTRAAIGMSGKEDVVTVILNDNVITSTEDKPFLAAGCCGAIDTQLDNISGSGNLWFSSAPTSVMTIPPVWDSNKITTDPLLTVVGLKVSVGAGSPVIMKSISPAALGIYGEVRQSTSNLGAVE